HQQLQHREAIGAYFAHVVGASDRNALTVLVNNSTGITELSHCAEFDADAYAVRIMRAVGLDAEEAARLFDSLGPGRDNASHPAFHRRAEAIRAELAGLMAEDSPMLAPTVILP